MKQRTTPPPRPAPTRTTAGLSPHLSLVERFDAGRTLRKATPRAAHGLYAQQKQDRDPLALLDAQNRTRVAALVPERYRRMLASPFAYLRGSAVVMAADLARTAVSGCPVQACGDMHVSNFGVFASAERNLVFAINDFDETLRAPWEWDVKRLCASAVVAGRFIGGDVGGCKEAARAVAASYRRMMNHYANLGYLDIWYARIDEHAALASLSAKARVRAEEVVGKAKQNTQMQVLAKLTDLIDSEHRILEIPSPAMGAATLGTRSMTLAKLRDFMRGYVASLPHDRRLLLARYSLRDAVPKIVGVGSVGLGCWLLYFNGSQEKDPLFLEVKEVTSSVLAPYWGKSTEESEGARVVVGQRIIQGAPDVFLGWTTIKGKAYYVRQLRDMKGGVELKPGTTKIANFIEYCGLCGWALALAHAKSGDPAIIAGYIGRSETLDDALVKFAVAYADQTERDYAALERAVKSGRVQVAPSK